MAQFLGIFGFLVVLLRAAILCFQTLAVGGVFFLTVVTRGAEQSNEDFSRSAWRVLRWSGLALAISQALFVVVNSLVLSYSTELPLGEVLGANFVYAGVLAIAGGLAIALWPRAWRRSNLLILYVPALMVIAGAVMTSHSASRMEDRATLVLLTSIHYLATATWIGGLPYLLMVMRRFPQGSERSDLLRRFSRLAQVSVAALLLAGIGMSWVFVGSLAATYGTAYGVMVMTKVTLLGCLLILGALNYYIVKDIGTDCGAGLRSLVRFGEVEIGIGLTVILAAASLTSQPPGADLTQDRVTLQEIATRFSPRLPRFSSPDVKDLSPADEQLYKLAAAKGLSVPQAYVPGQSPWKSDGIADKEWSEYNHNWAGLIVCLMGILALLSRSRYFAWAKVWPLMFLGLAVFLFFRADPENWPLGPNGFWESFAVSDVLQHRAAVVLITVFAIFQYRVEMQKVKSSTAALVFPLVCAVGGMVLLTHMHAIANIKEEMLAELSHTPLAIFGIVAGWSRWLELRLPEENQSRKYLAWIWPVCFIFVGLILMDYHEM